MDIGILLYLFGVMLPASVFCWAIGFLGAGFYSDPAAQPWMFRLVDRVGFPPHHPVVRLIVAGIGVTLFNAAQVVYLLRGPLGVSTAVIAVYFLAEAGWLGSVLVDIRRNG